MLFEASLSRFELIQSAGKNDGANSSLVALSNSQQKPSTSGLSPLRMRETKEESVLTEIFSRTKVATVLRRIE